MATVMPGSMTAAAATAETRRSRNRGCLTRSVTKGSADDSNVDFKACTDAPGPPTGMQRCNAEAPASGGLVVMLYLAGCRSRLLQPVDPRPSRAASPGMRSSTRCQASLTAALASCQPRRDSPLACSQPRSSSDSVCGDHDACGREVRAWVP